MAKNVLVEVYAYFGKNDGETLRESFVIEDTKENRKEVTDSWADMEDVDEKDVESFINGEYNYLSCPNYGGDWDDPTEYVIQVSSYESKLEELAEDYNKKLSELKNKFEITE